MQSIKTKNKVINLEKIIIILLLQQKKETHILNVKKIVEKNLNIKKLKKKLQNSIKFLLVKI